MKSRNKRGNSGKGGKKDGTTDEADQALAATEDGKKRRRKGKCHNCARECRSPEKEEVQEESAGTKTAQAPKPENKPVGSVNVVTAYDFEGDGFWMAEEKPTLAGSSASGCGSRCAE